MMRRKGIIDKTYPPEKQIEINSKPEDLCT